MKLLPIDSIQISLTRQRRVFDPERLAELTDSISTVGLLQPLVVRHEASSGTTILVAGERRLRAIKDLWGIGGQLRCNDELVAEGLVPAVSVGDLDSLAAFEAELEENIRRCDLSWQEQAIAVSKLHELRSAQAARRDETHSVADTAQELYDRADGAYHDSVKKQLTVARHLDDPDVAAASNFREAFKILERKEQSRDHAKRAALLGDTFGGHSHTLYLGDCLEWMAQMEPATFDVICTDPPYGMDADSFGDGAGRLTGITHEYGDSLAGFERLMNDAALLFDRVAKPQAHLYVCCDIDQFHWLKDLFNVTGWKVFRTPLINVKSGGGRVPLPEHGPRRCYETILYAHRGGKRVTSIYPDVIETKGDDNLGHGAQKPVGLIVDLLRRSVRPGDRVLDPFCGTGTIFPAAHEVRVLATGVEREASYYGIAAKRIEELK